MKKIILVCLILFSIQSYSQNKTYWMKMFEDGSLYISLVKNDSQFGSHFRMYFTGDNSANLIKVKYSQGKYKMETKNGWSYQNYLKYVNEDLVIHRHQ